MILLCSVSFLSKGKLCEAEDGPGLNISRDRANESCCSDDLERRSISKEELATGITEFSKGVNQPSPTSKRRNLDHWINEGSSGSSQNSNVTLLAAQGMKTSFSGIKSMSNKKNKHNLSSQPTIKSFFRRPETKPGDANINSLASSVDTVPSSVDTIPKMDELCSPKDDSLQENIQCTAAADGDPDNSNISSSLSTYKCNIATLEWQRIQQRMKMTLPLCKGHREPCIPRSVKKGSNIGRLFYVCARAQVLKLQNLLLSS